MHFLPNALIQQELVGFPNILSAFTREQANEELTISICLVKQRSHSSHSRQVVPFKLAHLLSCFRAISPISKKSVLSLSSPAIHCASPTSWLNRSANSSANPSARHPRATRRLFQPVPVVLESSDAHCCPRSSGEQGWIVVESNSGPRYRLQLGKLELERVLLEALWMPSQQ